MIRRVITLREGRLLGQLAAAMGNKQGSIYDTWMKEESDTVQALAQAFADREVLEACLRYLSEVTLPSFILA